MKEEYLIYLRKSRSDMEAELRGEGETLLRHEKTLKELADSLSLHITAIYREIVSGETIAARPYMQQLLKEVEMGRWAGVLVMEIERLARGDTIDQGIMAQTFKYSSTKIITPLKTYDPNNEFDEEYFEFGLFMSRREYKTINRRLQRGRTASIKEGKYVSSTPPYGYCRMKLKDEKGFTLEIIPEEANVIRCIYQWYIYGEIQTKGICESLGFTQIARKLNALGIKPRKSEQWSVSTIRDILKNEVYTGKVRWNFRPEKKAFIDGKQSISRPYAQNVLVYEGRHLGIIEEGLFDAARQRMAKHKKSNPYSFETLKNPLAGLVNCGICGHMMSRKPYQSGYRDTLLCQYLECDNASTALTYVEKAILFALEKWTEGYEIKYKNVNHQEHAALKIEKKEYELLEGELKSIQLQKARIFDAFEKGLYNTDTFTTRCKIADSKQEIIQKKIKDLDEFLKHEKAEDNTANYSQEINQIAEAYEKVTTIKTKNILLREVFYRVDYIKHKTNERKPPDCFEIRIYPNYRNYNCF